MLDLGGYRSGHLRFGRGVPLVALVTEVVSSPVPSGDNLQLIFPVGIILSHCGTSRWLVQDLGPRPVFVTRPHPLTVPRPRPYLTLVSYPCLDCSILSLASEWFWSRVARDRIRSRILTAALDLIAKNAESTLAGYFGTTNILVRAQSVVWLSGPLLMGLWTWLTTTQRDT